MFNRFWPHLFVMTPITIVVGVMIAALIASMMPMQYETSAVLEIRPLPDEFKQHLESSTLADDVVRARMNAAKQKLTSRYFRFNVMRALDLPGRWGIESQSSLALLGKAIKVEQINDTDLIRIRVRHANREDAMDIIRALLNAFSREQRAKWERSDAEAERRELRWAVAAQEEAVNDLRHKLQQLENDTTQSPLVEMQYGYEQELRKLQEMQLKLIGETLGGPDWGDGNPYTGFIVHDEPVMPESPIAPNVRNNLFLGGVIGLLAGPVLALFIMRVRRPLAASR